jgi:hypothetical protein
MPTPGAFSWSLQRRSSDLDRWFARVSQEFRKSFARVSQEFRKSFARGSTLIQPIKNQFIYGDVELASKEFVGPQE